MRGGGAPLEDGTRASMEASFRTSFDDVRVHADPQSDTLNRRLTARAFTTGSDIFLRGDASPSDSRLMAHELSHVVQQRSMSGGGAMRVGAADDSHEQHADSVANAVSAAGPSLAQREGEERTAQRHDLAQPSAKAKKTNCKPRTTWPSAKAKKTSCKPRTTWPSAKAKKTSCKPRTTWPSAKAKKKTCPEPARGRATGRRLTRAVRRAARAPGRRGLYRRRRRRDGRPAASPSSAAKRGRSSTTSWPVAATPPVRWRASSRTPMRSTSHHRRPARRVADRNTARGRHPGARTRARRCPLLTLPAPPI